MNEQEQYDLVGYYITSEPIYEEGFTPQVIKLSEKCHEIAMEGKPAGLKKIQSNIEKYPHIPQFKNYLSVWYRSAGQYEKSLEVNHWLLKEHPDYLFGKFNLAFEYIQKGMYEKALEVMGDYFDLKLLCPQRDTFHITEVISMQKVAIHYFVGIKDFDSAQLRLDLLQKIAPDFPETEQVQMHINLERAMETFQKELKTGKKVKTKPQGKTSKTAPPQFTHPEIEALYQNDFYIGSEVIDAILALPKETLTQDLELVLKDSIQRFSYFEEINNEEQSFFVIHALLLLKEIEATDSLQAVLEILSQSNDYLEFYLSDFITELLWGVLFVLGKNRWDLFLDFMKRPGIYTYSKTEISVAVSQLALHFTERKKEALNWYKHILEYYNEASGKDNLVDSNLIGLMISDIIEIKTSDQKIIEIIENLYQKGYVAESTCGTFEEVKADINSTEIYPHSKRQIQDIKSIYAEYIDYAERNAVGNDVKYNWDSDDYLFDEVDVQHPIVKDKKIGRNDPCPCGSGKKYKKCCIKK